jgi:repressor of nif and glnA expression
MKVVPVLDRKYELVGVVSMGKSKQRNIVVSILESEKKPMTVEEITVFAKERGLKTVGDRVLESVRFHLHQLSLEKLVKWEGGETEVVINWGI